MQRTLLIAAIMALTAFANATEPVVQILVGPHDADPGKMSHLADLAIRLVWTSTQLEI